MRKKISDEEADKLLEEQYIREAKEMEAGLLRSAGIDPEEESEPEAEEKIKAGYDHLMASLKRKGQYRERYSEDAIINFEDWNRKMEALRLETEKRKRSPFAGKKRWGSGSRVYDGFSYRNDFTGKYKKFFYDCVIFRWFDSYNICSGILQW